MKNRVIGKLAHRIIAFAFLIVIMGFTSVAGAVYYPPATRSVTWQGNVGVSGDIPNRTVIYKTLSPSGTDDTSAIQTAINNCPSGQVVLLSRGTFNITSIGMKSNVTLRGAGMGATVLKGNLTTKNYVISLGTNSWSSSLGSSYNLASGYTKGSTSITTSTSNGWQAGDVILIDQLNSGLTANPPVGNSGSDGTDTWDTRSSGTRALLQIVKVTSVSGNSATLEMPLCWSFDPSLSPQGTKLNIGVQNAGVENLTIDSSASWSTLNTQGTVLLWGAANDWLLGVEIYGIWAEGVGGGAQYRNTIRSCSIHGAHQYTVSSYALCWNYGASANLIEDCSFYDMPCGPVVGAGSGNVFAYNYSTNIYMASAGGNIFEGIDLNHGYHPLMNLFEGNYLEGTHFMADNIWGTSSHNTLFRNRVFLNAPITSGYTGKLCDVSIWHVNTYYNIIGNVLGNRGFENYYVYTGLPYSSSIRTIYALGATASNGSGTSGLETSTLIRHANWDSYTADHNGGNGVVWDPNISDHSLPQSLYLSAKPSWWTSTLAWPPIGPDLNPMDGSIPARQRYLLGNPPVPGTPTAQ